MRIALTGHRPGDRLNQSVALQAMIVLLANAPDDAVALCGGADGADRLWWKAADITGVPYELFVPYGYKEHYGLGPWFDRMALNATTIHWTQMSGQYNWKMNFLRNADMVNSSTVGVVCSDVSPDVLVREPKGGTRHAAMLMCGRLKRENDYEVKWLNSVSGVCAEHIMVKQQSLLLDNE